MTQGAMTFMPAQTRRAFDDIIDQVRDQIRAGALKPGQKLPPERDFAVQLGVSRNTVREAMRMLEIAGLVTLKKGASGGAFITANNSDALAQGLLDGLTLANFSIADLIEARIALETSIARQAAVEITEERLLELRALVNEAQTYSRSDQWALRLRTHVAFEQRLAEVAANPILKLLVQPLLDLTSTIALRIGPTITGEIWEERDRLLDALSRHDSDAAAAIVHDYLKVLHERWLGQELDEN